MASWHVATAAEAIAAAQFARFGYDVSVQYGANQPEYDLMIAAGEKMLKISVKGSKENGWGLSQSQLANWRKANPDAASPNYLAAADLWLQRHKPRTAMCFVNFFEVPIDGMPRLYLAWPAEVAVVLKNRGDTAVFDPAIRMMPNSLSPSWLMTETRVSELVNSK